MKRIFHHSSNIRFFAVLGAIFVFLFPWGTRLVYGAGAYFPEGEWGVLSWYASELLLWLCVIVFFITFIREWRRKHFALKEQWPAERIAIGLCALAAVIMFVRGEFAQDISIVLQWQVRFLSAIFLLLIMKVLNAHERRLWVYALLLGAVAPLALGFIQVVFQLSFSSTVLGMALHDPATLGASVIEAAGGRWVRAYGPFTHPNVYGAYAACMMFLCLLVGVRLSGMKERVLAYMVLVLSVVGVFVSFSRAAWLVAAAGILGLLYIHVAKKMHSLFFGYGVIALTALACFMLFSPLLFSRLDGGRLNTISDSERVNGITQTLNAVREHPLFGVGSGHTVAWLYARSPGLPWWHYQPVHNTPLLLLVEQGSVVTILLCVALLLWCIGVTRCAPLGERAATVFLLSMLLLFIQFDHFWISLPQGLWLLSVWIMIPSFLPLLSEKNKHMRCPHFIPIFSTVCR